MSAPQPEIKMSHLMEQGRAEAAPPPPPSPEAQASHARVIELKKFKDNLNADPTLPPEEKAIRTEAERRRKTEFSDKRTNELRGKFGNGEVSRDASGKIKGGTPEQQKNFEDADKRITAAKGYLTYSGILIEQRQRGIGTTRETIKALIKEGKLPTGFTETDYKNAKRQALAGLMEVDAIKSYVDGLGLTADAKVEYLEDVLVSDPDMRDKITKVLESVEEETKKLPSTKDPEQAQAQANVDAKGTLIAEQFKQLKDKLPGMTPAQEDAVRKALEAGDDSATIQAQLFEQIATDAGIPHPELVDDYFSTFDKYTSRKAQIDMYNAKSPLNNQEKQLLAQLQAEQTSEELKLQGYRTNFGGKTDAEMQAFRGAYDSAKILVYGKKAPDGTATVGGVSKLIESLTTNQLERAKEKARLDALKAAGGGTSDADRLAAESELIVDLDNIFFDATANTLKDRRDKLVELQTIQLSKQAEEAKESGDQQRADAIKALNRRMDENWIHYDPNSRKMESNRAQIGHDIRTLAYSKEDGIKTLITRDLATEGIFKRTPAEIQELGILKAKVGSLTPEEQGRLTFLTARSELTLGNFEGLNDSEKDMLTKIAAEQGDAYKNRLFADYVTARGSRAIFRGDPLNLRDHEILSLEKNYGGSFDTAIRSSKEGNAILEKLKQKGIRPALAGILTLLLLVTSLGAKQSKSLDTIY